MVFGVFDFEFIWGLGFRVLSLPLLIVSPSGFDDEGFAGHEQAVVADAVVFLYSADRCSVGFRDLA